MHPVVHFEIGARDHARLCEFYARVFGWQITPKMPFVMPSGEGTVGGHINCLGHEPHNYVTVYIMVPDLEAHLAMIESMGGSRIVPPTEVPGMGWFAWFRDPEGNAVGLWKPMQK